MPLHESEAIILHCYPLGEADRLVSFLSRTAGRVRGVAAGAKKPKSKFGSTLERLSYIRLWFFERENKELVRITQTEMIESFVSAFSDYPASVALSLFAEITQTVLPDREPSDANFRLLLLASQEVKRTLKPELPLAYFALWTVKLGGWLPALDRCSRCGAIFDVAAPIYFLPTTSAVVCVKCRRPGMRTISSQALAAARTILTMRLNQIDAGGISSRAARELSDVMLDVIEHHVDRRLSSRELLQTPL